MLLMGGSTKVRCRHISFFTCWEKRGSNEKWHVYIFSCTVQTSLYRTQGPKGSASPSCLGFFLHPPSLCWKVKKTIGVFLPKQAFLFKNSKKWLFWDSLVNKHFQKKPNVFWINLQILINRCLSMCIIVKVCVLCQLYHFIILKHLLISHLTFDPTQRSLCWRAIGDLPKWNPLCFWHYFSTSL